VLSICVPLVIQTDPHPVPSRHYFSVSFRERAVFKYFDGGSIAPILPLSLDELVCRAERSQHIDDSGALVKVKSLHFEALKY
jgi:nucleotidyltransferase/DNA polymerase involved in DNA repair